MTASIMNGSYCRRTAGIRSTTIGDVRPQRKSFENALAIQVQLNFNDRRVTCPHCQDIGWMCEEHPEREWSHDDNCSGPGTPCPACNQEEPPRPPRDFISIVRRDG